MVVRWRRWIVAVLFVLALALAFAAYFRPAFMVDLTSRWIFC